ncbi:hypothetical protein BJ322DRAFT_706318 [Thelephora terrestris]|uniref:Uncharacterized protein n=1 Tax=Thelephora terrestris TaxID=56493 RepID=A0A9P6HKG5_9AGAM|nr:hypothetical protein BJ322DRAFT_706318 [Thelephora terrestris]
MGVQDIVQLYEGSATESDPKGSLSRRNRYKPRKSDAEIIPPDSGFKDFREETAVQKPVLEPLEPAPSALPHRPARFVRHPFFQPHYQRVKTPDIPLRSLLEPPERREVEKEGLPNDRTPTPKLAERTWAPVQSDEREPLGSSYSDVSTTIRADVLDSETVKRFAASFTAVSTEVDDGATLAGSYSARLPPIVKDPSAPVHHPVPAPTLFSRNAAPLYLPKLNEYISSLPAPEFAKRRGNGKKDVPMFPPMEMLAASKLTIEDLEHNSTITPGWRDINSWFSLASGAVVGILGSSALAPYYSVQGLIDTVQLFALLLSTIVPTKSPHVEDSWRQLFLGTIPNFLALNFAKTAMGALIYLVVLMLVTLALLFYMLYVTNEATRLQAQEGFQLPSVPGGLGIVFVTFVLMVLYLPLSTMALHVVIWSSDLWVVPNPYINATSLPPVLEPLGPPEQYRDPLDFCWTTTMERNEINYAPVVVICALIVMASLTIYFPIHLAKVIRFSVPKVDKYAETGKLRSESELDREYLRILERDKNPFAFLYWNYRRGWSGYLLVPTTAKLATLLLTALINPDTCLFRSLNRQKILVARQIILTIAMVFFFALQCFTSPFSNPVNNASEWTSRLNFVLTSVVSLGTVLNVPGKAVLDGVVIYVLYILAYGLVIYFTLINFSFMQRSVKRLTGRVDFSVDVFSPRLDISPSSVHAKRRIWQEAISTIFLTAPSSKIPKEQRMNYAESTRNEYAPYLLDFLGSPGERHAENVKIFREICPLAYSRAVGLVYGPDSSWFRRLEETIQRELVGPDCFWKDPSQPHIPGCSRFFGNAWWIPFPPSLVIKFDDGNFATLSEVSQMEECVRQNASPHVSRKREIRLTLRALDRKIVTWPYDHIVVSHRFLGRRVSHLSQETGSRSSWCCRSRGYTSTTTVSFEKCVLRVIPRGHLVWEGFQLGSGLDVRLIYAKDVEVGGEVIGLDDDWDLTVPLARFLRMNQRLIPERLLHIEGIMQSYRNYYLDEARAKSNVLTYRFFTNAYDLPRDPTRLAESSITHEKDIRVRELMLGYEKALQTTYDRLSAVTKTEAATWWYIFWDDFWRKNYETIKAIQIHATDFNPHYPTSIAYRPLSRPVLEQFLTQRGLFKAKPVRKMTFHHGFLNMIYVRLNDIVFHGTPEAILVHLGEGQSEWDMDGLDLQTLGPPSTLGTGGGTEYDDPEVRARPTFRWEELMTSPIRECIRGSRWFAGKFGVWFGLTPLWRPSFTVTGFTLDVKLDAKGRYVAIGEEERRGRAVIPSE